MRLTIVTRSNRSNPSPSVAKNIHRMIFVNLNRVVKFQSGKLHHEMLSFQPSGT